MERWSRSAERPWRPFSLQRKRGSAGRAAASCPVTPDPRSQRVVRRAARSAQRLDGELDLLYVRPYGREPTTQEREQLESLRRLAAVLGCHLVIEEGDDVAEVAARVAREQGSTYVLMGVPGGQRGLRRLTEPLHDRLLRLLPGVNLRIVADRKGDNPQR